MRSWLEQHSVPIKVFLLSRVVFLLILFVVPMLIPFNPSAYPWYMRWDSGWYQTIASEGYYYIPEQQSSVAFFPALPMLIQLGMMLLGNSVLAGLVISNIALFAAFILLYKLMRHEFPDYAAEASRSLLYLAFAPAAIFLSLIYSETLFLALLLAAVYFARTGNWALSIVFSIFLGITRITGVLVLLFVALEWARSQGWTLSTIHQREAWRSLFKGIRQNPIVPLAIALIPLGLFSHMLYLQIAYGDAFLFRSVQVAWGRNVDVPFFASVMEMGALANALLHGQPFYIGYFVNTIALFAQIPFVIYCWRRLGASYGLYMLTTLLLPASASLTSGLRYSLVNFPLFMALALLSRNRPKLQVALLLITCLLYAFFALLFMHDSYFE